MLNDAQNLLARVEAVVGEVLDGLPVYADDAPAKVEDALRQLTAADIAVSSACSVLSADTAGLSS